MSDRCPLGYLSKISVRGKNPRKTDARFYIWTVCIQSGHATNRATAPGVWIPQMCTWEGAIDGTNKFAPPRRQEQNCSRVQICTRCKFLKHRSHGQKYTPGANYAYERGLKTECNRQIKVDNADTSITYTCWYMHKHPDPRNRVSQSLKASIMLISIFLTREWPNEKSACKVFTVRM